MHPRISLGIMISILAIGGVHNRAGADEPDRARLESEARGQGAEADRLFKAGDYAAALPLFQAERTSRAALGDLRYEAYAARGVGCCQYGLGDLEAAIAAWRTAQALDAKREDRGFEGYDWLLIGQAQLRRERPRDAIPALEHALPLLSKAIDRDHEADARLFLAHALLEVGKTDGALAHLERALALAFGLNDRKRQALIFAELGRVALERDEAGPAAEWLAEARASYRDQQLAAETATMDRLLGDALIDLDRPDAAQACVERAALEHERLKDFVNLADDRRFLAVLRADGGDLAGAADLARGASVAAREADDANGEIESLVALAQYQSLDNAWPAASATLDDALKLVRRHGTSAEQVRLLILAADVAKRIRRDDRVTSFLDEAQAVAQKEDNGALKRMVADAHSRLR